jgi:D-sedoheptulose 7-phosphate isomerase
MKTKFVQDYFLNINILTSKIDLNKINKIIDNLKKLKKRKGRLFILGIGGSASNASHAVNDFRKLCEIETYAPTDNVGELTARTNDEGFETIFSNWLKVSRLSKNDAILIFSVGGGNVKKNVSVNLINAIKLAKKVKADIFSIVGKKDGYAYKQSNVSVCVPFVRKDLITPYSEAFQAVIWHCLVSDPRLQKNKTKW